jgi:hypothetical protein
MTDLIKTCMETTGRTYPEGYGFSLGYLDQSPGVEQLRAMQEAAWAAVKRDAKAGGMDGARFVAAYSASAQRIPFKGGWPWWLIEAAQLVHADAMSGNAKSCEVMRLWNHPGY